jgi:transcriptional regulator with XRE-family HTH domain
MSIGGSAVQSIGANIKATRLALGLKQEDLADTLGWTQANVSRIEASVKGPTADVLLAVAGAMGCDIRELLGIDITDGSRQARRLDDDAETFVLKTMKSDPQFGLRLRNFVKDSKDLTEEDWKFLAVHLKLALNYAADAIKAKHLHGNF